MISNTVLSVESLVESSVGSSVVSSVGILTMAIFNFALSQTISMMKYWPYLPLKFSRQSQWWNLRCSHQGSWHAQGRFMFELVFFSRLKYQTPVYSKVTLYKCNFVVFHLFHKGRVNKNGGKCDLFRTRAYRLNEPNGVPWTSNATLHAVLIWMQAKLSCLDIQSNAICYASLCNWICMILWSYICKASFKPHIPV